ncbi:hypothetical protein [Marinilabilia salmonicolor]|uniref:hypothetical protein n=1 Tax=Marinilabilia salmonicolor TaxID=989 RepID=UPI000AF659F9|nr:hypothetical protein [Marinilabilia salmonicolor]
MNYRIIIVALLAMATLFSCKDKGPDTPEYPATKKVDTVDVYYGTEVADPYRWLEDDQSEETKDWVQRQVKVTNKYLSEIPFRDKIKERLTEVWNYEKQGTPVRKGKYWFFMRNNGLQNQYVVYVKEGIDGEERVLLDPNKLSEDGTVALSDYSVSEDGTYMAYSISRGGSDWREIYVLDVATGEQLDDHLEWVKFSGISWMGEEGFVYSRYDAPAKGEELTNVNEFQQVFYHKLGEKQSEDELIYKDPVNALRNFTAEMDDDNKSIILSGSESTSNNSFLIREWNGDEWAVADTSFENNTTYLGTVNGKYWVLTDFDAPRYRIMAVTPDNPGIEYWEEVVAEKGDVLNGVALSKSYAVAHYMVDAESKLLVFDFSGEELFEIELPGRGSVGALRTIRDDDELFYSFDSYNVPGQVIDFNLETKDSNVIFEPEVDFDGDNYETRLVFIEAEDGARCHCILFIKKVLNSTAIIP